jgi:hypothetical protein
VKKRYRTYMQRKKLELLNKSHKSGKRGKDGAGEVELSQKRGTGGIGQS